MMPWKATPHRSRSVDGRINVVPHGDWLGGRGVGGEDVSMHVYVYVCVRVDVCVFVYYARG